MRYCLMMYRHSGSADVQPTLHLYLQDLKAARVGDTWVRGGAPAPALPGFRPARPMMYAGLFPVAASDFDALAVVSVVQQQPLLVFVLQKTVLSSMANRLENNAMSIGTVGIRAFVH